MLNIDKKIFTIDQVICRHLAEADNSNRGMISQDVLSHLRNFVEHLMLKCYADRNDIDNTYENICKAIKYVAKQGKLKVLSRFHDYLQIVASHYTLDEENSERLMLKYYVYLLKIKNLMHDKYSIDILQSLDKFPLRTDQTLQEYYNKIADRINAHSHKLGGKSEKYYIQKIKPFIVSECVYYEVTFTPANDYSSKFDRVIAFTNIEVTDYYAVKFTLERDSSSVTAWLENTNQGIDCDEKAEALKQMFECSRVALIYGAAGTGKTTLINHVAHFFADRDKIFLAQSNPAVDNLKRRVTATNSVFMTITKFLGNRNRNTNCDVLVIDECSTVNNRDMIHVLQKVQCKLLLLVGDSHQIASIRFGNWFGVARYFVPATSVFELEVPFRSTDKGLLTLWSRVRKMDETILELITKQGYSTRLDDSIFSTAEKDEIILCLNYDGLYGINNINRFLQENNPHSPVTWGILQYKIDDPILFNESERFTPIIYNNMKGRIVGIERRYDGTPNEEIQFDIELETVINELDAWGQEFELLENSPAGNSIIRFVVKKTKSVDDDGEDNSNTIVPFQVAYAVSIHKAQGLEYRSVKIVITDEVDEMISHSIFYTAITRAREKLKIYWTPEVENKVLSNMAPMDRNKDVMILRKYGL